MSEISSDQTDKHSSNELTNLLRVATSKGQELDLSECCYGPPTGKGVAYIATPMPYYYLLAGLARVIDATSVLENGTHFGGGALSFLKGMSHNADSKDYQLVTIDTNSLARVNLDHAKNVEIILGEAQKEQTITKAALLLPNKEIDIVFIDALKSAEFICEVVQQLVHHGLSAKYLILDDIAANDSMKSLWRILSKKLGNKAVLVSKLSESLRNQNTDMAILDLNQYGRQIMEEIGALFIPTRVCGVASEFNFMNVKKTTIAESKLFQSTPEKLQSDDQYTQLRRSESKAIFTLVTQYFSGKGKVLTVRDDNSDIAQLLFDAINLNDHDTTLNSERLINVFSPQYKLENQNSLPGRTLSQINLHNINSDSFRWTGEDIELAIVGPVQTQKQFSNIMSEILAHSIPGKTYILLRDFFVHYRLWASTTLAMLSEFIQLKATDGRSLIIKLNRTIPNHRLRYVATYNFTFDEMDSNLEILANKHSNSMLEIDLKLQLGWLRLNSGRISSALQLCQDIESTTDLTTMSVRLHKFRELKAKIEVQENETPIN